MCKAECPFKATNGQNGRGCQSHQHLMLPPRQPHASSETEEHALGCARQQLIAAAEKMSAPLPDLASLMPSASH